MTAHRSLQDNLIADAELIDPGNGGSVLLDRTPCHLSVTTTAAETRVLALPSAIGHEITVSLDVDGGDLVVTQAGSLAINQAGDTTVTLADAGDSVTFVAIALAGALVWRVKSADGVVLS